MCYGGLIPGVQTETVLDTVPPVMHVADSSVSRIREFEMGALCCREARGRWRVEAEYTHLVGALRRRESSARPSALLQDPAAAGGALCDELRGALAGIGQRCVALGATAAAGAGEGLLKQAACMVVVADSHATLGTAGRLISQLAGSLDVARAEQERLASRCVALEAEMGQLRDGAPFRPEPVEALVLAAARIHELESSMLFIQEAVARREIVVSAEAARLQMPLSTEQHSELPETGSRLVHSPSMDSGMQTGVGLAQFAGAFSEGLTAPSNLHIICIFSWYSSCCIYFYILCFYSFLLYTFYFAHL
jgi:hypothetical protein